MAYRRRQGIQRNSTFKDEICYPHSESAFCSSNSISSPSFVSSPSSIWHRDSLLSSSYSKSSLSFDSRDPEAHRSRIQADDNNIVGNKTAYLIQETRKLQIRRKGGGGSEAAQSEEISVNTGLFQQAMIPPLETSQQVQLKASRDLAMATAAKAKLLLRELKTVKADMAFSKERCTQLEEENRILRESRDKGDGHSPADDDLIRLQLETLLAEKARLAHENSVYARENRLLREVVECHQMSMEDVEYLEDCIEEVTEEQVSPVSRIISSRPSPLSPNSPTDGGDMIVPQPCTPAVVVSIGRHLDEIVK